MKEEAGYRCAIPNCRGTSALEVAHIVPYSDEQEHQFENLILLCAVCHQRFDSGEIARSSIEAFKTSLAVVNGRYSDFERRALEYFADSGDLTNTGLMLTFHHEIHLRNLLRDGLLELVHQERHVMSGHFEDGIEIYALTGPGRRFVERWVAAQSVE